MESTAASDEHLLDRGLAIVGLGGCFPDAPDIPTFWRNTQRGHVAIAEVPKERWPKNIYWSEQRSESDCTYSAIGAFIRYDHFDRKKFRLVPRSLPAIDAVQKWALMAVAEALADAGLEVFANDGSGKSFDRERCAVILGNAMGGEQAHRTNLRVWLREVRESLVRSLATGSLSPTDQNKIVSDFWQTATENLPTLTEDSMVGELSNCITGRIANVFNLNGPNFTTDAACASSLAALSAGAQALWDQSVDVALVGGADRSMDPSTYAKFSRIGALSSEGSRPFDKRASGFVMGEGAGILVIKRLADAIRDGDRIRAVIRGIGASSDGAGKGLTAPNPRGQKLAIERAWKAAQVPLASAGLIEAHGTSTPVGDAMELRVLTELLAAENSAKLPALPIGSVKSNIGHLKSAAGAASLIKATLALEHKILPPSAGFEEALADSPLHEGRLAVNTQTRPWPENGRPRRAGVSSFGFGGINFHVVLEHFDARMALAKRDAPLTTTHAPTSAANSTPQHMSGQAALLPVAMETQVSQTPDFDAVAAAVVQLFAEHTGYSPDELELDHHLEGDLGIDTVKQAEVLALLRQRQHVGQEVSWRLAEMTTLRAIAEALQAAQGSRNAATTSAPAQGGSAPNVPAQTVKPSAPMAPVGPQIVAFGGATLEAAVAEAERLLAGEQTFTPAVLQARHRVSSAHARVACVATTPQHALDQLRGVVGKKTQLLAAKGIFVAEGEPLGLADKLCFLFPGQGSQYLGMLQDLAGLYPVVQKTFAEADAILTELMGRPITPVIWPHEHSKAKEEALKQTDICQPAMLTADVAMLRLLEHFGVRPASVAGHSLGEYAAAVAAEVMTFREALFAVSARGREMANVQVDDTGKMAVVAATAAVVEALLETIDGYVIAANKNCHTQTVIAGATAAVDQAMAAFAQKGIEAQTLPVSHAFHSAIVAPATEPLRRVLKQLDLKAPKIPLCANANAVYFPNEAHRIVELMAEQLASPVEFIRQVERLWSDGARLFVEVGPRRALTGFVRNVLGQRPHRAMAANHPKKSGQDGLFELLAALVAEGASVSAQALGTPDTGEVLSDAAQTTLCSTPSAASSNIPRQSTASDDALVISGLSAILPRSQPIGELGADPLAALLAGDNFIGPLSAAEKQSIIAKRVTRLDKDSGQFLAIDDEDGVLKLAGKVGDIDLAAYGIEPGVAAALDATGRMALAAGIDALRDAGLPLVRRMRTTSTQSQLFDRWGLPPAIAERTGVILASAFPGFDAAMGTRDTDADQAFDRKWIFRALSMGHAQLAQHIMAQGPNTQINAACASGSQAIAIASDWIRLGRCDRVIVVSADDVTRPEILPWLGAGFLAVGSASIEPDVSRAAVPFGKDRNGLVLGAGATAMVIERESDVKARGLMPMAEIVATHIGNSAFHGTRLDSHYIRGFFAAIVQEAAQALDTTPKELAPRLIFMSHETYTPARGGSSQAEVDALRHTFGDATPEVLVANTKGFTGHAMGASLEDACAVRGLQLQQLPKIANAHNIDPVFSDLRLSTGGSHRADLALRFAAGFGSQVAAVIYKRRATQMARLVDPEAYASWCQTMGAESGEQLEVVARTLRIAHHAGVPAHELGVPSLTRPQNNEQADSAPKRSAQMPDETAKLPGVTTSPAKAAKPGHASVDEVLGTISQMFADETGYGLDELEPDHALEADLGIDTVKQAELFAMVRKHYALEAEPKFSLADAPTLSAWAQHIVSRLDSHRSDVSSFDPQVSHDRDVSTDNGSSPGETPTAPSAERTNASSVDPQLVPSERAVASAANDSVAQTWPEEVLLERLMTLFSEQTGYSLDELDPDHALEADLGIDTVKQAEILALVRQEFALPKEVQLRLSDMPTLKAMAQHLAHQLTPPPPGNQVPKEATALPRTAASTPAVATFSSGAQAQLQPLAPLGQALVSDTFDVRQVVLMPHHPGRDAEHQLQPGGDMVVWGDVPEKLKAELHTTFCKSFSRVEFVSGQSALGTEIATRQRARADTWLIWLEHVASSDAVHQRLNQLFCAFRDVAGDQALRPEHILVVSQQAQGFGLLPQARVSPVPDADFGVALLSGASGMLKTLAKEWESCRVVALDVVATPEGGPVTSDMVAHAVLAGWSKPSVNETRERVVLTAASPHKPLYLTPTRLSAPAHPSAQPLAAYSRVVVTGGARGVTYALVCALARRRPLNLTLIARTQPLDPKDSPIFGLDDAQARALAQTKLKAAGERATPAAARAWVGRLQERSVVWQNLQDLRAMGCDVELLRCDLADANQRQAVVDEILAHKEPVALLLHGAGAEESRFLADKAAEDYSRLAATKVWALEALVDALKPQRTVTLGSVAGRFGNAGQADYAAANELLAARARRSPHTLNLAYTAWEDVGMATRGSTRQVLMGLGVHLAPMQVAVDLGVSAIESTLQGDCVVSGPLGVMAAHESKPPKPFTTWEGGLNGDEGVRLGIVLQPQDLAMLDHHRIDHTPVLPGVMGVEMMVSAAAWALQKRINYVEDVRFDSPVKSFGDKPLRLNVQVVRASEDAKTVVTLKSAHTTPSGGTRWRAHFALHIPDSAPPMPTQVAYKPLPSRVDFSSLLDRASIYQRYFHGPAFQVLPEHPHLTPHGVVAERYETSLAWRSPELDASALTRPKTHETAFQAAGLFEMVMLGRMVLPHKMERVWFHPTEENQAPMAPESSHVYARLTHQDDAGGVFDIITGTPDAEGTIVSAQSVIQGYRSVVTGPLTAELAFDTSSAPRLEERLTHHVSRDSHGLRDILPLCGDDAVAMRRLWLNDGEMAQFDALKHLPRRLSWLAGRLMVKRLVAATWPHPGAVPALRDIVVVPDVKGAPQVRVEGCDFAMPSISISHAAGVATALLSWEPQMRLGVDVEAVVPRDMTFVQQYFTAAEQKRLAQAQDETLMATAMWAGKEAVLKVLGIGARIDMRDIVVAYNAGDKTMRFELVDEAMKRAEALGIVVDTGHVTMEAGDHTYKPQGPKTSATQLALLMPKRVVAWVMAERRDVAQSDPTGAQTKSSLPRKPRIKASHG